MEVHLKMIGILLVVLALGHLVFPKYFNWKMELQSLSLINQQIMKVHTFFIGLTVFLMGLLCLSSASDLVNTSLGKRISLGIGIFWLIRLIVQFFFYSKDLWKGKCFETGMHMLFSVLWFYLSFIFLFNCYID